MNTKEWTVRLTTAALPLDVDIDGYGDDLLSALLDDPGVGAASLLTNLQDRTISIPLEVHSDENVQTAVAVAVVALTDAGRTAGYLATIAGVEASMAGEPVPA